RKENIGKLEGRRSREGETEEGSQAEHKLSALENIVGVLMQMNRSLNVRSPSFISKSFKVPEDHLGLDSLNLNSRKGLNSPLESRDTLNMVHPSGVTHTLNVIHPSEVLQTSNLIHPSKVPQTSNLIHPSEVPHTLKTIRPSDVPHTLNMIHPSEVAHTLNMIHPSEVAHTLNMIHPSEVAHTLNMIHPSDIPQTSNVIHPSEVPRTSNRAHPIETPEALKTPLPTKIHDTSNLSPSTGNPLNIHQPMHRSSPLSVRRPIITPIKIQV
ncbi:unnamed protein product, partial [Allacma fusca]